jgi:hypothetical protein
MNLVNPTLLNSETCLQSVLDKLHNIKSNLRNVYERRRKRAASPLIQTKSSAASVIMNSDKTFTEKQS